jgi:VanZ family protein
MRLSDFNKPYFWRIILACYWLTLLVLTHLPGDGPLTPATKHDKLAHMIAYALLAIAVAMVWKTSVGSFSPIQLGWTWLALIVAAGLDEWTQTYVGREASIGDWVADAIGTTAGLALVVLLHRRGRRRPADESGAAPERFQ